MFRFHKTYFLLAVILFLVEVYIALYVRDAIVRPYVGDFLVVIFLYCLARAFLDTSPVKTGLAVLLFSYIIELSQYLNLVEHLGLQHSKLANIVMGNSFEWIDLIAYTAGVGFILVIEHLRKPPQHSSSRSVR